MVVQQHYHIGHLHDFQQRADFPWTPVDYIIKKVQRVIRCELDLILALHENNPLLCEFLT